MEYTILLGLLSVLFAITFLQSGIDKSIHRQGNLDWFRSVFEKTFLGQIITPLFYSILVQELIIGLFMVYSAYGFLFLGNDFQYGSWGFLLCVFVLLQLFFGQRIAKDYVGASGILPYVILATVAFYLSAMNNPIISYINK